MQAKPAVSLLSGRDLLHSPEVHLDREPLLNSVDPDQTLQNEASDQSLCHLLHIYQH